MRQHFLLRSYQCLHQHRVPPFTHRGNTTHFSEVEKLQDVHLAKCQFHVSTLNLKVSELNSGTEKD